MPTRNPRLEVYIDNVYIPGVLSARVNRGMDQEMATADVQCRFGLPSNVGKWSKIIILMGVDNFIERFVGWVVGFGEAVWPAREALICVDEMGLLKDFYPLDDVGFNNKTDQQIVKRVLQEAGLPSTMYDIQGTGKKVGGVGDTKGLHWSFIQSALEVIKEVDSFSLGYRTYCESSGMILRRKVKEFPGTTHSAEFQEGIDIVSGSANFEQVDPKTQVNVVGGKGAKSKVVDPNNSATWRANPWWKLYRKLQKQAQELDYLSTDEVAAWIFARLNRTMIRVNLTTHRDDLFGMLSTIKLTAAHLRTNDWQLAGGGGVNVIGRNFWMQSLTTEIDQTGRFRQQLGLVTEWHFDTAQPPGGGSGNPPGGGSGGGGGGGGGSGGGGTTIPPSVDDITVDFSISIGEMETVIVGGSPQQKFTVVCVDLSTTTQGTITTRVWAAVGGNPTSPNGTGKTFTCAFDGTGGSITLTITNSNGHQKSLTRSIAYTGGGQGTQVRKLYGATTTDFWAFDGTVWRSYTPSSGPMTALAPGPVAAAEEHGLFTNDDLATAAIERLIFPLGDHITSIWTEPDASSLNLAAGSDAGFIALSFDGGVTWQVKNGPGGLPIRRIIISRYVVGQIHVVTNTGYYVSDNYGDGWRQVRSGDFDDVILSHSRNVLVTTAGQLLDADTIIPFTTTLAATIVCAAPNIREDKFYAIDTLGRTWYTSTDGGIAMIQGATIPTGAGTAKPRGMWRDGSIVDVVYFATSNGLYKTADGFKSTGGYLLLHV